MPISHSGVGLSARLLTVNGLGRRVKAPSRTLGGSWVLQPSLLAHMPDQRVLPDRVKTALKTALATVLAYGVALSMDWDNAYWAAFAVAFCTLSTVGESLTKGLLRLSGTLVGSSGRHHSHCPVPAGSLVVPHRHEPLCRLLHLHDAGYLPMVFLVRRRVLDAAPCPRRRRRPSERFSDGRNSYRGNSAGHVELQPGLSPDLADQYP